MHWLDLYRSSALNWHQCHDDEHHQADLYRRMGVVETAFDHDGTDFEGRADVHALLTLHIKSSLTREQFREHVTYAWACMRLHHLLMSAVALDTSELPPNATQVVQGERNFLLRVPTFEQALQDARETLTFVEDHYGEVDPRELYRHAMNTARTIDAKKALAKMFVLPVTATEEGEACLRFLNVAAHQITDGFSTYTSHLKFVEFLNMSREDLIARVRSLLELKSIRANLPPAQESLYPQIPGNRARQRWFWAISRIFRHTRRVPPACFPNPLRRTVPLSEARALDERFNRILQYMPKPPLNSFVESARVSKAATRRVQRLCKEVNVSIGAGCFTLCALAMMKMQEELYPRDTQPHFVGSFPLNPRPFLASDAPLLPSIMLAFSDGLHLPFLPSSLPLEARFRLLARQANRQLRVYQKGTRASQTQPMGLSHPSQLLPSNYIGAVERTEDKLPAHRKKGLNPQGAYPAAMGNGATCGVSSIGARNQFLSGARYDLSDESKAFAASFVDLGPSVRARDGECLVGSSGDDDGLYFSASYDGNALDETLVKRWKEVMETMFKPESRESRL